MKQGFLKVAAATPKIRVADPAFNAQAVCQSLDSCFTQKAKIIVLPELCLTGYTCGDLFLQERLLDGALEALKTVITYTKGMIPWYLWGFPMKRARGCIMWRRPYRTAGCWR